MNKKEFNTWWMHYTAFFPEVAKYFQSLPEGGKMTIAQWFEVMEDLALDDCIAVNKAMACGDVEAVPAHSRGTTPGVFRKAIEVLKRSDDEYELSEAEEVERRRKQDVYERRRAYKPLHQDMDVSMKDATLECERIYQEGGTHEDVREYLRNLWPDDAEDENDRRRWVKCRRCKDSGLVRVWHSISIRAWMNNTLEDPANQRTAMIACDCEKGQRKVNVPRKDKQPFFTRHFNLKVDCPVSDPHDAVELADFVAWCEQRNNESHEWNPNPDDYPGEF